MPRKGENSAAWATRMLETTFKTPGERARTMNGGPLNQRQQAFVDAYLVSGNATKAAMSAGYSEATAQVQGPRLLKNVKVAAEIQQRQQKPAERAGITRDRVMLELAKIGFSDVRSIFTPDGRLKAIADLDDEAAGAIASVEVVTRTIPTAQGEEPEVEYIHKIRLADKRAALVDIARMHGWDKPAGEDDLAAGMRSIAQAISRHAGSMPIAPADLYDDEE